MNRSGSCAGYSWEIEWKRLGGDQPEMGIDGQALQGSSSIDIEVQTLVDGGTIVGPLRGDMLRTPEHYPQVSLIVIL